MRFLLILLLALVTALVAGNFLADANGFVQINAGGWIIQFSVVFFVLALVVGVIICYLILRSFFILTEFPQRLRKLRKYRHQELSDRYLRRGLTSLIEGSWKKAEKELVKGAKFSRSPGINYLFAARAAQRQGKPEFRDHYLSLTHESETDVSVATAITQAELLLQQQQSEQALAMLNLLQQKDSKNARVKLLLLKTYLQFEDWDAAANMLKQLETGKSLDHGQIRLFKLEIWKGKFAHTGKSGNVNLLDTLWQELPRTLKKEEQLVQIYVTEKIRVANTSGCEKLLNKAIRKNWSSELVYLYGLVKGSDPARQLAFAESLQQQHARDPLLLLTVGRLAITNSQWEKAQSCLRESLELKPLPETCRELAIVAEYLGDYSDANRYYEQGLVLATSQDKHDSIRLLEQAKATETVSAGARLVS